MGEDSLEPCRKYTSKLLALYVWRKTFKKFQHIHIYSTFPHATITMDEPELAGERLSMYGVPVTPFARSSSARDDAPDTDDSKASSTFFIGSLAMRELEGSKHSPDNDEEDFTMTPQSGPQQQSCSHSPTPQPLFLRIKQTQLPTLGDNQLPPPPPPPPPPPLEEQVKSRSSGVQVIRVVVPNFPGKSSSSSSQYFKEPLFYIPKVPELTKVPDPQPPKKAPLTGYDMRTLRKQVEFLQIEIQERMETQQLLYKQNEELWNYAQTLNQCNSSNVNIMRDQVNCAALTNISLQFSSLTPYHSIFCNNICPATIDYPAAWRIVCPARRASGARRQTSLGGELQSDAAAAAVRFPWRAGDD